MNLDQLYLLYAGLLSAGGAVGYFKSGSVASLVAGCGSGAVVFLATRYQFPYRTLVVGGVALVLGYVMGQRYSRSQKFMPAGLISGASLLTLLASLYNIVSGSNLY